jgi:N-acetyl-anhydromuramyl-L-alanine amidase AmpD
MTPLIDTSHHSPNHSSRNGSAIKMIVLHATAGSYESSLQWLCNPASQVSTHYLIDRDGSIDQLVPDSLAAWHAGRSAWMGMKSEQIQHCSIGIELVNRNNGHDIYPDAQLASASALCRDMIARYNIERADVVRHKDIAIPKGRKSDPAAPFPWPAFADRLYLDNVPVERHYRVKAAVTGSATVRAAPRRNALVIKSLHAGDDWYGLPVFRQLVTMDGFGSSTVWICNAHMFCVWSGLLEEVTE